MVWALGTKRNGKSKYLGVSPSGRIGRPWRVDVGSGKARQYRGCFVTEVEAAHAYDRAAKQVLGERAVLNF